MLPEESQKLLFTEARSHNGWLQKPVSNAQLEELYDLMKYGPTAANNCPLRITFIKSIDAREKLKPHLSQGNVVKALTAPVLAILSYDTEFYNHLPHLFPHTDAKSWYENKPAKIESAGTMNATLQGAYFLLAARSIGLDCGPMAGFNNETLNNDFFPDGKTKSIFICGIGYGDDSQLHPRGPRLDFNTACKII